MNVGDNRGFIHDSLDIKILILYILARLPGAIDFDTLAELTLCDGGVGYFDFTECAADLVKTEHITLSGGKYEITEKGRRNGAVTESNLPYPVRIRADAAAAAVASRLRRAELTEAYHDVRPRGGCTVKLAVSDGTDAIMRLELFASDVKQAAKIENAFRKNAEKLYTDIMEALLNE